MLLEAWKRGCKTSAEGYVEQVNITDFGLTPFCRPEAKTTSAGFDEKWLKKVLLMKELQEFSLQELWEERPALQGFTNWELAVAVILQLRGVRVSDQ